MADPFEDKLTALFDEPLGFSDEAAFLLRFERRMERQTRLRRLLLWGAGVAGAAVAVVQGVGSGLGDRFSDLGGAVARGAAILLYDGDPSAALQPPGVVATAFVVGLMALFLIACRAADQA